MKSNIAGGGWRNRCVIVLCLIAGVRRDVLDRVPHARGQAATLGLLLVLTPSLSGVTMGYAIFRVFDGDRFSVLASIAGSLVWTGIIFGIERALLLGIDKAKGAKRLLLQALVRLPLAAIIGVTVSQPLLLRICRSTLDRELHDLENQKIDAEAADNARRANLPVLTQELTDLERADAEQEKRAQGEPDSREFLEAKRKEQEAGKTYVTTKKQNERKIEDLETRATMLSSGDPLSQKKVDEIAEARKCYQGQIDKAAAQFSFAERRLAEVEREWIQNENQRLHRIESQVTSARSAKGDASVATEKRNRDTTVQLELLMKPNLANEYTILKRIESDPNNPDAKTLSRFELGLGLLFFILECVPLGIKLLSRWTPIDDATLAVEREDREKTASISQVNIAIRQKQAEVEVSIAIKNLDKKAQVANTVDEKAWDRLQDTMVEDLDRLERATVDDLLRVREQVERFDLVA